MDKITFQKGGTMKTTQEIIDGFVKEIMENVVLIPGGKPLDGDETQNISSVVHLELDKVNGNLTDEEYLTEKRFIEKYGFR